MTARRPHPGPQAGDRVISPGRTSGYIRDRDRTRLSISWDEGGEDTMTRAQFRAAFRPDGTGRWTVADVYLP